MSYACDVCFKNHNPEEQRLYITIPVIRQRNQFNVLKDLVIHYNREVESRVSLFSRTLRAYSIDTTNMPYQNAIQRITTECTEILRIMFAETRGFDTCAEYQIINIARIHDTLFTRVSKLQRDIEELITHINSYFMEINQEANREEDDEDDEEEDDEDYEEEEEDDEDDEEEDDEDDEEECNIYRPLLRSFPVKKKDVVDIGDLECKVCYDTSDINKRCVLNCSHSLCIDCVYSHIVSTKKRKSTVTHYSCPICRANIKEIIANYVESKSKKENQSFCKNDLISSESYQKLQTECKLYMLDSIKY
jgi:hypothetical protein